MKICIRSGIPGGEHESSEWRNQIDGCEDGFGALEDLWPAVQVYETWYRVEEW